MTSTDYTTATPPADKDPADYDFTERRADLLERIFEVGSPKRLNTSELSDVYGVTRRQIYHDYDALAEFIEENLGERAKFRTQSLYERVLDELIDKGEYREAWKTTLEWNQWLVERGALDKVPEKLEADVTTREAETKTEAYEIVGDDDEIVADSEAESDIEAE